jgi:hypothetical protein
LQAAEVTYFGEITTDSGQPYYYTDAPEIRGGPLRMIIVVRLRPLADHPRISTRQHWAARCDGSHDDPGSHLCLRLSEGDRQP